MKMRIGNRDFDTKHECYVCGILNMTPDSFSDGGSYANEDEGYERAVKMMEEGAKIIDVGGLSTRPGYVEISIDEEINRILPVIKKIRTVADAVISVDTYRPEVALAAVEAGADMINDISCLKDERLAEVAARTDAAYCLMHNREVSVQPYVALIDDIKEDLQKGLDKLLKAGVKKEKVMIDPGIGFAKDYEENLRTLAKLDSFTDMGYPLLLGISRKSVIGKALDTTVDQRLEGTIALNVYGLMKGVSFIRVHDIKANAWALKMIREVMRYG